MTTLDWVTCFLWYLARAARRKFYFCNLGARSVDMSYHWVSADLNTKVERRKTCKKYFRNTMLENPNPDATFFAYVKLLISLLNGAFFRLGDNFSVRGYGAKFWAADFHQLFKADSKNPSRLLLRSRFGEKLKVPFKTAHCLMQRCTFSARGKFFGPGPRGKIFGGIYTVSYTHLTLPTTPYV